MEDTESSDFLSSSGSLCSSLSHGTNSTEQVGFDVFLSDGLTEAAKAEEDFDNVRMIPNSRLSSADHPVLIRLENEYQARRSMWHRHPGQCCRYSQETEGRTSCSSKNKPPSSRLTKADHPVLIRLENEYQARRSIWQHNTGPYCRYSQEVEGRTSCPSKNKLASRGSPLRNGYRDLAFPDGSNLEAPQGLKRQRNQEAKSPANWWREKKEQNLPLSDGDRIFAQKCRELQGFIKPLTELLNGLKRGRYDRGLSSFQQSLAMDRIQRIVGVLQKPEMGERYLSTLLQVEMMLKVWFPGVTSSSSSSSSSLELDTEQPQNKMAKHPDVGSIEQQSCQIRPPRCLRKPTRSRPSESLSVASVYSDYSKDGVQWPTLNLTWMHTSPICNPPLSQVDIHHLNTAFGQDLLGPIGSSCGIIFLVQNSQASTPTTVSGGSEERSLDETPEQCPPRSQSAPPIIVHSDSPNQAKLKNHSYSFPYLSACMQTSGGENT